MFAAPHHNDPFLPSLLSVGTFFGLFVGYGLGRVHALWRRARSDYVKTKDSVPVLRSEKWAAWWSMVQRGAVVAAVAVALLTWLVVASLDQPGK
jgi:hypothetical protein